MWVSFGINRAFSVTSEWRILDIFGWYKHRGFLALLLCEQFDLFSFELHLITFCPDLIQQQQKGNQKYRHSRRRLSLLFFLQGEIFFLLLDLMDGRNPAGVYWCQSKSPLLCKISYWLFLLCCSFVNETVNKCFNPCKDRQEPVSAKIFPTCCYEWNVIKKTNLLSTCTKIQSCSQWTLNNIRKKRLWPYMALAFTVLSWFLYLSCFCYELSLWLALKSKEQKRVISCFLIYSSDE